MLGHLWTLRNKLEQIYPIFLQFDAVFFLARFSICHWNIGDAKHLLWPISSWSNIGYYFLFTIGRELNFLRLAIFRQSLLLFMEYFLFCQRMTDEGVTRVCEGCPQLETLCLSQIPAISDQFLLALGQNCLNIRSDPTPISLPTLL